MVDRTSEALLANYIADYVNEELVTTTVNNGGLHLTTAQETISGELILKAIDAFEGGAR